MPFASRLRCWCPPAVDLVIIETMMDVNEAVIALQAARSVDARLPVVVQMTIREDGDTPTGTSPEEFTRRLDEAGADVIGLNCGVGPASMLKTLKRMASATTRKLSAQPNAGIPRKIEGRYIYESSPESMAEYSGRFVQARGGGGRRLLWYHAGSYPHDPKGGSPGDGESPIREGNRKSSHNREDKLRYHSYVSGASLRCKFPAL